MAGLRTFLVSLCIAIPCAAEWTEPQKGWALGTSAVLTEMNGNPHNVLWETSLAAKRSASGYLSNSWDIHTRAQLLETISSLMQSDRDRLHIGWNYPRVVSLSRWGYGIGFLTETEAWNFIFPAAQRLQQTFSSWQELGLEYLGARRRFYTDEPESRRYAESAFRDVATDPNGPWRKYPWNLDLGSGHPVPPSQEKSAWIEVAAHPEGLMCFRMGVPNHEHDEAYLAAIEEAVGCHPHITRERSNGPDWILDTECTRPGTSVGAEVIATFHLEAVAELLRRDGVTQVFTFFEHIPHDTSSLFPTAYDSYVANGWRFYTDTKSLRTPLPDAVMTYGVPPAAVRKFLFVAICFVALSLLAAVLVRSRAAFMNHFPVAFWAAWLLLSVSFRGLAVASLWSGSEGLVGNIQGLTWYGTVALLLRMTTEGIMKRASFRDVRLSRLLAACFWQACTEIPIPISIAMLCDPDCPLEAGVMIIMLSMGAAVLFIARRALMVTQDMKGGLVKAGELHDAVFQSAAKLKAPLRRLYLEPDLGWPRALPSVGARGELMIPERLIREASRREVDGLVSYNLMLIKQNYVKSVIMSIAPLAVVLAWRAYMFQHSTSGNLTLLREAGVLVSAFVGFQRSVRTVYSRTEVAFRKAGGDTEGWLAGLVRAGKLAGVPESPELIQSIAKASGIAPERVPDLAERGFPETGQYPVPDFARSNLVLIS